jgi:hypothetical protein
MNHHALGRLDEATGLLRSLEVVPQPASVDLAAAWAFMKELDAALRWLGRALDDRAPELADLRLGRPWFRDLRGDPRWKAFMERLRLPPEAE